MGAARPDARRLQSGTALKKKRQRKQKYEKKTGKNYGVGPALGASYYPWRGLSAAQKRLRIQRYAAHMAPYVYVLRPGNVYSAIRRGVLRCTDDNQDAYFQGCIYGTCIVRYLRRKKHRDFERLIYRFGEAVRPEPKRRGATPVLSVRKKNI